MRVRVRKLGDGGRAILALRCLPACLALSHGACDGGRTVYLSCGVEELLMRSPSRFRVRTLRVSFIVV